MKAHRMAGARRELWVWQRQTEIVDESL